MTCLMSRFSLNLVFASFLTLLSQLRWSHHDKAHTLRSWVKLWLMLHNIYRFIVEEDNTCVVLKSNLMYRHTSFDHLSLMSHTHTHVFPQLLQIITAGSTCFCTIGERPVDWSWLTEWNWWKSRDSLLVERRTRDRKVASSNTGRSCGRIFFSSVNFVRSFSVSVPPLCYRSGT